MEQRGVVGARAGWRPPFVKSGRGGGGRAYGAYIDGSWGGARWWVVVGSVATGISTRCPLIIGGPTMDSGVSESMPELDLDGDRLALAWKANARTGADAKAIDDARLVGGIFLPAVTIRVLAGALVVVALGLPWLARYAGALDGPPVLQDVRQSEQVRYRPELVRLPAGRFTMGSPLQEEGRDEDETPHEVEVASFELCRTEVTVAQWRAVTGEKPSDCTYGCEDHDPVQNVSWEDATQYLNQLTWTENERFSAERPMTPCYEQQGDRWIWVSKCDGFRLPTETEWEYAARADTESAYSFGNDASRLGDYAWYSGNSSGRVHEVASKTANPWGLFDMHGNVWEWVWDWHGDYPLEIEKGFRGPEEGSFRVLRGGSFFNWPESLRSANRLSANPTLRHGDVGLRCARSLSAEPLDPSTP